MKTLLVWLFTWAEVFLGCKAYSFQTFSVGQVLTASQMNQVEVNVRDHVHGTAGVSDSKIVQVVEGTPYTANTALSTTIPGDDTIPQITEGTELVTVTITPHSATNRLRFDFEGAGQSSGGTSTICAALFQGAIANALYAIFGTQADGFALFLKGTYEMAAGTTSATTFRVRVGPNANTFYTNGVSTGRIYGGVAAWRLRVTEIQV